MQIFGIFADLGHDTNMNIYVILPYGTVCGNIDAFVLCAGVLPC
jgi:hypothetical protein